MLLIDLCNAAAPSGYEGSVRDIIKNKIKGLVDDLYTDRMGNIIAHKNGNGPKVAIYAHMDESGFIITGYNEDGTLKFSPLGKINPRAIASKVVYIGDEKIPGVIGLKPIHLQDKEEREKNVSFNQCCIDIGTYSKDESKKIIKLGEYAVFSTEFREFGDGLIKGKSFDNRIGCAILVNILKENYDCDLYGIFSVQEKVGQRGAFVSTFNVKPDICIVVDTCRSDDVPNVPNHLNISKVGRGPIISMMDRNLLFSSYITKQLIETANKVNIPYQCKSYAVCDSEAYAIEMTEGGAKIGAMSIPCRYGDSSVSVCSLDDYNNAIELMIQYLKNIKLGR